MGLYHKKIDARFVVCGAWGVENEGNLVEKCNLKKMAADKNSAKIFGGFEQIPSKKTGGYPMNNNIFYLDVYKTIKV